MTAAPEKTRHDRDPFLDNAKLLLLVLVVVGHLLERAQGSALADGLYTWIYLFHMPAFVAISGYLSRSFTGAPRQYARLLTTILAPYVVFQLILSTERWLWINGEFTFNLFKPNFALWYLLALFVWRLLTPLLRAIPYALPLSIAISLLSVTYGGISQELSGARILSFLPFFTVGLLTTPDHLEKFKRLTASLWVRVPLAAFVVASFIIVFFSRDWIARRWLYMYGQYDKFHLTNPQDLLLRAAILVAATVVFLAVLALVPRCKSRFTYLGTATLYMYLLQAAIIYPLMQLIEAGSDWSTIPVIGLIVAGVLLAFMLGTPLVQKATKWFIDPFNSVVPLIRRSLVPAGKKRD